MGKNILSKYIQEKVGPSKWKVKLFLIVNLVMIFFISIMGSVVYINFIKGTEQEVYRAKEKRLQSVIEQLDSRFRQLNEIAVHIETKNGFFYYTPLKSTSIEGREIILELKKYIVGNEWIQNIAFWRRESKSAYTTDGIVNIEGKIEKYADQEKPNYLKGFPQFIGNQSSGDTFQYIYPLPLTSLEPTQFIAFTLFEKEIDKIVGSIFDEEPGYLHLYDENGELLYTYENNMQGIVKDELMKQNFEMFEIQSVYNGLTYKSFIETKAMMKYVTLQYRWFIIFMLLLCGLNTVLSIIITGYSYLPIKVLKKSILRTRVPFVEEDDLDEVQFIDRCIHVINKKSITGLQVICLQKLLQGIYKSEQDKERDMQEAHLYFPYKYVCTVVLYYPEDESIESRSESEVGLKSKLESLGGKIFSINTLEENMTTFIINLEIPNQLNQYVTVMEEQLSKESCVIGISELYEGIAYLDNQYRQAHQVIYNNCNLHNGAMFYNQLHFLEDQIKYSTHEEFISDLKKGNAEGVINSLEELTHAIKAGKVSIVQGKDICYIYTQHIIKIIHEMNIPTVEELRLIQRYLYSNRIREIYILITLLKEVVVKICKVKSEIIKEKRGELKNKILELIEENLSDNNLSLGYLAESCNVSQSYLSRYFKEHMGYAPGQYIDHLRIEHSKYLLRETDVNLNEILRQIGYIDKSNFIRKFKKAEGITPISYRRLYQTVDTLMDE